MTSNQLLQLIEATVDYIEQHIKSKLTLDILSNALNLSKFHLHRLIKASTGLPLSEYIRARKLSKSVEYLIHPKWKIIDISLEFNFDHEQSYIRSFKKQFGLTPAHFRKGFKEIILVEKLDLSRLRTLGEGLLFEPYFVMKPTTYLVGKKHQIYMEENYCRHTANTAGNDFFYHELPYISHKINENLYIGLTRICEGKTYSFYYPSTEVYSFADVQPDQDTHIIPAHKFIVFKYIGDFHPRHLTFHQLQEIWTYIDTWLPQSAYAHVEPFYYEYIDAGLASEAYCEVDLYIPIVDCPPSS